MDGEIDAAVYERSLQLRREHPFTADLSQWPLLGVSGGADDFDLDAERLCMEVLQLVTNLMSLGERKFAAARAYTQLGLRRRVTQGFASCI